MHKTFTPFASLVPAPTTSSYLKREQIVTKIFLLALEMNFALYLTDKLAFFLTIDNSIIHIFVLWYQTHIEGVVNGIKNVCDYCSLFILFNISIVYSICYLYIQNFLAFGLVILLEVDYYAISENTLRLCKKYIQLLSHVERSKFGFRNGLFKLCCQSYSAALKSYSIIKKAGIARAHLVVSIFKIKLNSVFNPATYNCIKGHVVLLSQNLTSLLNLLLSLLMKLHNNIYII